MIGAVQHNGDNRRGEGCSDNKFTLVTQPITCSWTTDPVLSQEGGSGNEAGCFRVVGWLH